jgi:hypothetical protein
MIRQYKHEDMKIVFKNSSYFFNVLTPDYCFSNKEQFLIEVAHYNNDDNSNSNNNNNNNEKKQKKMSNVPKSNGQTFKAEQNNRNI